jgi:hypothetical protein
MPNSHTRRPANRRREARRERWQEVEDLLRQILHAAVGRFFDTLG